MKDKKCQEVKDYKTCSNRGVASQGQTTTPEYRADEKNHPRCEICGVKFNFDDETGYFFHPV